MMIVAWSSFSITSIYLIQAEKCQKAPADATESHINGAPLSSEQLRSQQSDWIMNVSAGIVVADLHKATSRCLSYNLCFMVTQICWGWKEDLTMEPGVLCVSTVCFTMCPSSSIKRTKLSAQILCAKGVKTIFSADNKAEGFLVVAVVGRQFNSWRHRAAVQFSA